MKKFFKVLAIILIVAGTIAGTCFLFYSTYLKNRNAAVKIDEYLMGAETSEFNTSLYQCSVVYDNSRITQLIDTKTKLDNNLTVLSSYLILADEYKFDENRIINDLEVVIDCRSIANESIQEFLIKSNNDRFDAEIGANALVKNVGNYLIEYAKFVSTFNDSVESRVVINNNSDLKFDMINLYSDVVIHAYSNLTQTEGVFNLSSDGYYNLQLLNENYFIVDTRSSGYVKTDVSSNSDLHFTLNNNYFMKYYDNCDKNDFASHVAFYVYDIEEINDSSTNCQKASFYLKKLLGV